MKVLNGINFWTNGKDGAAIIDKDDNVLISFDTVFENNNFTKDIKDAMVEYGFDMKKQRMLTSSTLEDAIMHLNVSRMISKQPLTVSQEKLDNFIKEKMKEK
jgi:hypothetical protein